MTVKVIEAKEDKITTADLIAELKKSTKVDYSGAIFTFDPDNPRQGKNSKGN